MFLDPLKKLTNSRRCSKNWSKGFVATAWYKDENAKELVEKNDIEYIENKCTKMEYQKFF
jgi:predicted CoA-binding protein